MDGRKLRSLNESVGRILFEEDGKSSQQKKIGTYRTRFFHLCPGAQQVFPEIEDEIGGKDAGALAQMADKIFQIEDTVLKAGEPNEQASSAAREVYGQLMKAARKFGVDDKLDFMQGHLDIIDKGSKDEEDEEKPGMRGMGGFAGEMGGSLDGGSVDGGMGGGMVGESFIAEEYKGKKKKKKGEHYCASHTEHYKWGKGRCISESHAEPDRYGHVAWYDVEFNHGVERGVPVSEMKILMGEDHTHMKEALDPVGKEDGDIDNDGKANTPRDKYLKNRRKAIGKAMGKKDLKERKSEIFGTLLGEDKKKVNEDPDTQADFHQHLDDSGVLLAKDHAKHGIKGFDMMDDEKNAYAFSSSEHDQLSDPHKFHDMENQGVSAVGFMPKGGLDLDPQKVRAERMMTSDHQRVMDMHKIKEQGNTNESYTPKDLREATMNRIKKVSSNIGHNSNPVMDRFRGI